jgi:hypothetical protein
MPETNAVRTMRNFIERQREKLLTIEAAALWRHGYVEALDNMTKVLAALTAGQPTPADDGGTVEKSHRSNDGE